MPKRKSPAIKALPSASAEPAPVPGGSAWVMRPALRELLDRYKPQSSEQRAAELRAEREQLHKKGLRGCNKLSLFLIRTCLTEKEAAAIVYDHDLPGSLIDILQQQIAFVVNDEKARKLIPQGITSEQLKTAVSLVWPGLYNDLTTNLRLIMGLLLVINFFDRLNSPASEATIRQFKEAVLSQLFKSDVKRRKGSGRPRQTTASALRRDVTRAAKSVKRKGLPVILPNVAAEMGKEGKALGETLRSYRVNWKGIKSKIIGG